MAWDHARKQDWWYSCNEAHTDHHSCNTMMLCGCVHYPAASFVTDERDMVVGLAEACNMLRQYKPLR